jgi:hypothetical protein
MAAVSYEPKSSGGPTAKPAFSEPPLKISGDADRYEQKRGKVVEHFARADPAYGGGIAKGLGLT